MVPLCILATHRSRPPPISAMASLGAAALAYDFVPFVR